jgi:phage protein D
MAKSPYYKVFLQDTGEDITEYISAFDFEMCVDKDDLVKITVDGANFDLVDRDIFDTGKILSYHYGFIGGKQSDTHIAVITDATCTYKKQKANLVIQARDKGILLKKLTSQTVKKNVTLTDVGKEIAEKFGMDAIIDVFEKQHPSVSQGNATYMDWLKKMALYEGSTTGSATGPVEVYVNGNTLYIKKRDLSVKSSRTFQYGDGNGQVKEFQTRYEGGDAGGAGTSSSISSIDYDSVQPFTSKADGTTNQETKTGSKETTWQTDITNGISTEITDVGKNVVKPVNNKADADDKIGAIQKGKGAKVLHCKLEIELDPTIVNGVIVTMAGVAKRHCGNWRAESVTHSIKGSGAFTILDCIKNGAEKSPTTNGGANEGDVNKTQGDKAGSTTRQWSIITGNQL